jgi:hypothetical protein
VGGAALIDFIQGVGLLSEARMTALLTGNRTVRGHIEEMEKLIVWAALIAIAVFVAIYALSAWSEHRH